MGDGGLACLWKMALVQRGWSKRAAELFSWCWAPSTQKTYDRLFENFKSFLAQWGVSIVSAQEVHLADFLTLTARCLARPKTTLHGIVAAVDHGCGALGLQSLVTA